MRQLTRGMRNDDVRLMQRLLNKASRSDRISILPLNVDGIFGPRTEETLRAFQTRHHVAHPGVCANQTWSALGATLEIRHDQVRQMGQPTTTSCWATAAAMILGDFFPTVGIEHMAAGGYLRNTIEDIRAFGEDLGWTMPIHSPTVDEALGWLSRKPLWLACAGSNFAHALVLSGAWGDGTATGTLLRLHDPWPPGNGRIYHCLLDQLHEIGNGGQILPLSLQYVLIPN